LFDAPSSNELFRHLETSGHKDVKYQPERVSSLLISSFNGEPQAVPHFATACGSPLNENARYVIPSTVR
jgi:hypothetical protein